MSGAFCPTSLAQSPALHFPESILVPSYAHLINCTIYLIISSPFKYTPLFHIGSGLKLGRILLPARHVSWSSVIVSGVIYTLCFSSLVSIDIIPIFKTKETLYLHRSPYSRLCTYIHLFSLCLPCVTGFTYSSSEFLSSIRSNFLIRVANSHTSGVTLTLSASR